MKKESTQKKRLEYIDTLFLNQEQIRQKKELEKIAHSFIKYKNAKIKESKNKKQKSNKKNKSEKKRRTKRKR